MPRPKTISDENLLRACRAEFIDRGAGALTDALVAIRNARAQKFGESRCDRSERERRYALPLGSTEM